MYQKHFERKDNKINSGNKIKNSSVRTVNKSNSIKTNYKNSCKFNRQKNHG